MPHAATDSGKPLTLSLGLGFAQDFVDLFRIWVFCSDESAIRSIHLLLAYAQSILQIEYHLRESGTNSA